MSDRIFGFIAALVAGSFFVAALGLEAPLFSDPLGPKAFPILIAIMGFIAACFMIFKPDADPKWPGIKTFLSIGFAVVVLIFYALSLKYLGFIIPTMIATGLLSYQINPKPLPATFSGIGIAIVLFAIFKFGFGLSLKGFAFF